MLRKSTWRLKAESHWVRTYYIFHIYVNPFPYPSLHLSIILILDFYQGLFTRYKLYQIQLKVIFSVKRISIKNSLKFCIHRFGLWSCTNKSFFLEKAPHVVWDQRTSPAPLILSNLLTLGFPLFHPLFSQGGSCWKETTSPCCRVCLTKMMETLTQFHSLLPLFFFLFGNVFVYIPWMLNLFCSFTFSILKLKLFFP